MPPIRFHHPRKSLIHDDGQKKRFVAYTILRILILRITQDESLRLAVERSGERNWKVPLDNA
jgi:hypothetical protein